MPIKKTLPKAAPKPTPNPTPAAKKRVAAKPAAKRAPVAPPKPVASTFGEVQKKAYDESNWREVRQNEKAMGPELSLDDLPGADESCPSVTGQTWQFYSIANNKITAPGRFFEDGTFTHNTSPGRWRQRGAAIVFELNGRYAEYTGVISGDTITGHARNIRKLNWEWSASRQS